MANDVLIRIVGEDRFSGAAESARRSIQNLNEELNNVKTAAGNSTALKGLADRTKNAMGGDLNKIREATASVARLQGELRKSKQLMGEMKFAGAMSAQLDAAKQKLDGINAAIATYNSMNKRSRTPLARQQLREGKDAIAAKPAAEANVNNLSMAIIEATEKYDALVKKVGTPIDFAKSAGDFAKQFDKMDEFLSDLRNSLSLEKAIAMEKKSQEQSQDKDLQDARQEKAIQETILGLERQLAIMSDAGVQDARTKLRLEQERQRQLEKQARLAANPPKPKTLPPSDPALARPKTLPTSTVSAGQTASAAKGYGALKAAVIGAAIAIKGINGAAKIAGAGLSALSRVAGGVYGAFQKLIGMGMNVARVFGAGLIGGLKGAARGLQAFFSVAGRGVGVVARLVGSVANLTRNILNNLRVSKQAKDGLGAVVDPTGWHSRQMKGLVGNVVNLNRWINTLGSSVRQLGQAFQNVGLTTSIFLSYPAQNTLKGMTGVAMAYQDQLIEIRKNANITNDELKILDGQLRSIVSSGPLAPEEVATIAADAARIGVPTQDIAAFTEVIGQLTVATTLDANEATDSIGRVLNIFYDLSSSGVMKDTEQFTKIVQGFGSALNELGQANAVTEDEIVAAMLRVAPAAKALGMSIEDTLALSTSVASGSASAERAGTQLATALGKVASNLDNIAGAGKISSEELTAMLEDDPAAAFMAVAKAIQTIESPVQRLAVLNDLMGQIGGKAASIIGATGEKTVDNVKLSREEFAKATSLALEYERAMDSVQNQAKMLKNQFSLMAMSIGDTILPVLTEIFSYLVPSMQAVVKMLDQASPKFKMMVVAVLGLVAVLGPLLFIIGSLMFSIGIAITGFTGLVTVIGSVLTPIWMLFSAILSLLTPFNLLLVGIGIAVAGLFSFTDVLGGVGAFIQNFARNMYTWGYNAFVSFGNGIIDAGMYVYNSVVQILESIAGMLRSFSPPKEGPLKDIDKWGENLATTFADAFRNGSIGGVVEYTGYIAEQLESVVKGLNETGIGLYDALSPIVTGIISAISSLSGGASDVVEQMTDDALGSLVNLVSSIQNGTNDFATAMADLGKHLGGFAKDFEKVVSLQIQYNAEADNIEKIDEELSNLDSTTRKHIKSIAIRKDMTAEQKIAAIRAAKVEASERKTTLEEEKKISEEKRTSIEQQLETQKKIIDIIQTLMATTQAGRGDKGGADGFDGVKESAEEAQQEIGNLQEAFDGIQTDLSELGKNTGLDDLVDDAITFADKMDKAKEKVIGFIDALLGKDRASESGTVTMGPLEKPEGFQTWNSPSGGVEVLDSNDPYNIGYGVGGAFRKTLQGIADDMMKMVKPAQDAAGAVSAFVQVLVGGGTGASLADPEIANAVATLGGIAGIAHGIGSTMAAAGTAAYMFGLRFSAGFSKIVDSGSLDVMGKIGEIIQAFIDGFSQATGGAGALQLVLAPAMGIADALGMIAGYVWNNLDDFAGILGQVAGFAANVWQMAAGMAMLVANWNQPMNSSGVGAILGNMASGGNSLMEAISGMLALGDPNATVGENIVKFIVDSITGADWTGIGTAIGAMLTGVLFGDQGVLNADGMTIEGAGSLAQEILGFITGAIQGAFTGESGGDIGEAVSALFIDPLKDPETIAGIGNAIGALLMSAIGFINGLDEEGMASIASQLINNLLGQIRDAIPAAQEALAGIALALVQGLNDVDWNLMAEDILGLWFGLIDAIAGSLEGAPELGAKLGQAVGLLLAGALDIKNYGTLVDGQSDLAIGVIEFFENLITTVLTEMNKNLFGENAGDITLLLEGISGFSGKMQELALAIFGIIASLTQLKDISVIFSGEDSPLKKAVGVLQEVLLSIGAEITTFTSKLSTKFGAILTSMADEIGKWGSSLADALQDMWWDVLEQLGVGRGADSGPEPGTVTELPMVQRPGAPAVGSPESISAIQDSLNQGIGGNAPDLKDPTDTKSAPQDLTLDNTLAGENAGQTLLTGFQTFMTTNIPNLLLAGMDLATNVLAGVSVSFLTNFAQFGAVLTALNMWKGINVPALNTSGSEIASDIVTGLTLTLTPPENFDSISTSIATFVAGVTGDHPISKSGESLGKKVAKSVKEGIEDNWKVIADGLRSAIERALSSVKTTVNSGGDSGGTPPPPPGDKKSSNVQLDGIESAGAYAFTSSKDDIESFDRLGAYIESAETRQEGSTINLVFNGDMIVDSKKRMDDLADEVSKRLAKRIRYAGA